MTELSYLNTSNCERSRDCTWDSGCFILRRNQSYISNACTSSERKCPLLCPVPLTIWKWPLPLKLCSCCIMSKNMGIVALRRSGSGVRVTSRIGPTMEGMNLILWGPKWEMHWKNVNLTSKQCIVYILFKTWFLLGTSLYWAIGPDYSWTKIY